MSKVSPTVVSIFIPDLEELQSKSVIRNLLMKHKYNTFRIKNNILNKYSIPSQAMPLPPPLSLNRLIINELLIYPIKCCPISPV